MPVAFEDIEPLLMRVEKPARYVGGEFNRVVKHDALVRVCLAFPDVYDLGMSYHGYSLLYERVNRNPQWAAERAFTPWPDFEALLRESAVPLHSLETRRALSEFDVVGFTLQHEVNYTNILTMLDLGGIPIDAKDRTAPFPLVVGGGEGAYSPEPMAPFFDAFVIGDGEEALDDVCAVAEKAKLEGWDRERLLLALAATPGVYVPGFYETEYLEDGRVKRTAPTREGVPAVVKKRHFNVTNDKGATRPVVPLLRTVHDRFAIEIRRGCVNGCRFCQAGMITRPVRERSVEQIVEIAAEGIANTGYDEISLLSLSSADYTAIGALVRRMSRQFGPRRVSISLPSLRINAFDVDVADEIRGIRKSGFTFAPEAGSARMRKVINKEVDQEDFLRIIGEVFERGWQTVKFYFMVGLPTETDEDLDGIVEITRTAAELGRRRHGRKAIVNVTLSPFVPKSNTPFQWEAQPDEPELNRRYEYVRKKLRGPNIDVKTNDTGSSFIEACLARGDRRMSEVVRAAWKLGARFDGWDEYFRKDIWLEAFRQVGLDPKFYANRQRGEDEVFPFDHIDSSLGKRFLWADQRRAWRMRVMERCEVGKCAGCVACDDTTEHVLARDQPGAVDGQERYHKELIDARAERSKRLEEGRRLEDPTEESMLLAAETRYAQKAREIAEQLAAKAASCGGGGNGVEGDGLEGEEPDSELRDELGAALAVAPDPNVGQASLPVSSRADEGGGAAPLAEADPDRVFSHYRRRQNQPVHRYAEPEAVSKIRLTYTKLGPIRFLSHLDLIKTLNLCLRRGGAPLSYSQGFNPQPKVSFAPPLPVGFGGRAEPLDALLIERVDIDALIERMNEFAPEGLLFLEGEEIDLKTESIDAGAEASEFVVELDFAKIGARAGGETAADGTASSGLLDRAAIEAAIERFLACERFPVEVRKKAGVRTIDLRESLEKIELVPAREGASANHAELRMTVTHAEGRFVQPHVSLGFILDRPLDLGTGVRADRARIRLAGALAVV